MFRVSTARALVFAVAAVALLSAEHSSAQLPLGCAPALSGLTPCISYLVSNSSSPASACCSPLASMVQTQAQCVCAVLGGGITQLGFLINQTQALKLPGACNIRFSTSTSCNGFTATVPAPSPTSMPTLAPPPSSPPPVAEPPIPSSTIPSNAPPAVPSASAPSGNGSKTTREASMARSSTKFTPAFFFSLLFAAFYTWI